MPNQLNLESKRHPNVPSEAIAHTMTNLLTNLCCPTCGSSDLGMGSSPDGPITCGGCTATFSLSYGLPNFSHNHQYYWGELERETFKHILAASSTVQDSLSQLLRGKNAGIREYLLHYALDRRRAGWKYLLPLAEGGRVLDFGCGWGALALSLSPHFAQAWVSDVIPERVAVAVRRLREQGCESAAGVVCSGWPRLPFPDEFFDQVVINGVLEWMPTSIQGCSPKEVHRRFLCEVARVLKPTGVLYIGVENRYGYRYFQGQREEHTKLRFVSLLPRFLGRLYHRLMGQGAYRTYTYGRRQFISLLADAGYKHRAFWWPYPDYREFDRMVCLDDRLQIGNAFSPSSPRGRIAHAVLKHPLVISTFARSFGIMCRRQSGIPEAFHQRVLRESLGDGRSLKMLSYRISPSDNVLVRFRQDVPGIADGLLVLPMTPTANARLRLALENRRQVIKSLPDCRAAESTWCPQPLAAGVCAGVNFCIDQYVPGISADRLAFSDALGPLLGLAAKLHSCRCARRHVVPATFLTNDSIDRFLAAAAIDLEGARLIRSVLQTQCSILTSHVHGDFHAGNVIVRADGKGLYLKDWDLYRSQFLPVYDVLSLLTIEKYNRVGSWPAAYGQAADHVQSAQSAEWREYAKALDIDRADILIALLVFPIMQFDNLTSLNVNDGKCISDDIATRLTAIAGEAVASMGGTP